MALTSFLGGNSAWDPFPDPFEYTFTILDSEPGRSYARDAQARRRTNLDWKETATEHVISVDLPGLRKEDIQVQIEDDRTLHISGERHKEEVRKSDTWHRVERSHGTFHRKLRLPKNANVDHIKANVENGVLRLTVPKIDEKDMQPRRIEIGGDDSNAHHGLTQIGNQGEGTHQSSLHEGHTVPVHEGYNAAEHQGDHAPAHQGQQL